VFAAASPTGVLPVRRRRPRPAGMAFDRQNTDAAPRITRCRRSRHEFFSRAEKNSDYPVLYGRKENHGHPTNVRDRDHAIKCDDLPLTRTTEQPDPT
jgi:hypothetical protein